MGADFDACSASPRAAAPRQPRRNRQRRFEQPPKFHRLATLPRLGGIGGLHRFFWIFGTMHWCWVRFVGQSKPSRPNNLGKRAYHMEREGAWIWRRSSLLDYDESGLGIMI